METTDVTYGTPSQNEMRPINKRPFLSHTERMASNLYVLHVVKVKVQAI